MPEQSEQGAGEVDSGAHGRGADGAHVSFNGALYICLDGRDALAHDMLDAVADGGDVAIDVVADGGDASVDVVTHSADTIQDGLPHAIPDSADTIPDAIDALAREAHAAAGAVAQVIQDDRRLEVEVADDEGDGDADEEGDNLCDVKDDEVDDGADEFEGRGEEVEGGGARAEEVEGGDEGPVVGDVDVGEVDCEHGCWLGWVGCG